MKHQSVDEGKVREEEKRINLIKYRV